MEYIDKKKLLKFLTEERERAYRIAKDPKSGTLVARGATFGLIEGLVEDSIFDAKIEEEV